MKLNEMLSTDPSGVVRSQSTLSNVGTESSGQNKDSGFSDLLGRSEEDAITVRRTDSAGLELPDNPTSEQQLLTTGAMKIQRLPADASRKRTFLLRRTKSERRAEDPSPLTTTVERIKYKADIPISVIRAAQAKTRRFARLLIPDSADKMF